MIKATEPSRKILISEKNAVTGRLALENKLQHLSNLQHRKQALSRNDAEKAVLKYHTSVADNHTLSGAYTSFTLGISSPRSTKYQEENLNPSANLVANTSRAVYPSAAQAYTPRYLSQNDFKIPAGLIEVAQDYLPPCTPRNRFDLNRDFELKNSTQRRLEIQELSAGLINNKLNPGVDSGLPTPRFGMSGSLHFPPTHHDDCKLGTISNSVKDAANQEYSQNSKKSTMTAAARGHASNNSVMFTPSAHYTSSVSKSMTYQTWSNTLAPSDPRPGSANINWPGQNGTNISTNTFNSYLRRVSEGNNGRHYRVTNAGNDYSYGDIDSGVKSNGTDSIRLQEDKSRNLDRNQRNSVNVLSPNNTNGLGPGKMSISASKVSPDIDNTLRAIAITNSTPRARLLVASNSVLSKNSTSDIYYQKSKNMRSLHRHGLKYSSNGNSTSSSILSNRPQSQGRHISSIPNQNSRTILDGSFTVQNSTNSLSSTNGKRLASAKYGTASENGGRARNVVSRRSNRVGSSKKGYSQPKPNFTYAKSLIDIDEMQPDEYISVPGNLSSGTMKNQYNVSEISKTFRDMIVSEKSHPRGMSARRNPSTANSMMNGEQEKPHISNRKKSLHTVSRPSSRNHSISDKKKNMHGEQIKEKTTIQGIQHGKNSLPRWVCYVITFCRF